MCLAVYIASDKTLPLIEWKKEKPAFNVVPLTKHENGVKRQFSRPFIAYAGSHEGCGCGFFKEGEEVKELEIVQANYDSLVNYLKKLKEQGASIEIYSCWEGDQEEEPEFTEKMTLEEISGQHFEFKEKAYYKIA